MSQIQKKWIGIDQVGAQQIELENDQCLRGRNNANSGSINLLKVNATDEAEFCSKPVSPFAPVNNDDLVNRAYVLDVLAGLRDPKDACLVATTANIDLATGGTLTIDGIGTFAGARVLVKDQTLPAENGIYEVAAGAWARSSDADDVSEFNGGESSLILEGTINARKLYVVQFGIATLGTDPVVWVQAPNPANFLVPKQVEFTIAAGDIINGYVDLAHEAEAESVKVAPDGGPKQRYNTDYTISTVSNVTRITWAGNLASIIAAGDVLLVDYSYATS